ncbi:Sel1 repeat family protein [Rhizophagus irregularis DAOM 181602=DAOM 197198]|nr:Sel1 repeat family protein [Rhizophagus irregularis DAOM 181602=DAOM 197198]
MGKAFHLIEEAAEKGSKDSQHYLGTIYRHDKGDIEKAIDEIYQDLDKSLYWYEKSSNENGRGMQKYIKKAIEWYEKSAIQEYNNTQYSCFSFVASESSFFVGQTFWSSFLFL